MDCDLVVLNSELSHLRFCFISYALVVSSGEVRIDIYKAETFLHVVIVFIRH